MARIYTDGAETGDSLFWTSRNQESATSGTIMSGNYYYKNHWGGYASRSFTAVSEGYWRQRVAYGVNGAYTYVRSGNNTVLGVTFNNGDGSLTISGATTGSTGAGSVALGRIYLLEIYLKLAATPNGSVIIKIDGKIVFSFTGTTNGSYSTVDTLRVAGGSGNGEYIYTDDLAMNDTSGSVDNSWCGDGKVYAIKPNAAGDATQWTPSTGDNYATVDDIPPSDTDYVYTTTSGYIDNYNLTTLSLATGDSVSRLWLSLRAKDAASGGVISGGVCISGINYTEDIALPTDFGRIQGSELKTNPNTGLTWTQADLDALQIAIIKPT